MTLAFPTPSEYRNPNRASAGTFEPLTLSHTLSVLFSAPLRWWKRHQNRRAMMELATLEDRLLDDIGVTRDDVYSSLAIHDGNDPSWHLKMRANERHHSELCGRRKMQAYADSAG